MSKTYVNLAFADAVGKNFNLRVDEPKADVDAASAEAAAAAIIASKAFRKDGELKALKKAEKITVQTQVLVNHEEV